jgi:hypothetical protein
MSPTHRLSPTATAAVAEMSPRVRDLDVISDQTRTDTPYDTNFFVRRAYQSQHTIRGLERGLKIDDARNV